MKTNLRNLIVILMISLSFIGFSQEGVEWITLDEALALNEKNPKKIIVDVYTDWCGWCKVMDKKTYTNNIIVDYIEENFYPVKFDAEQKEEILYRGQKFINKNEGRRSAHEFAIFILKGQMSYPNTVFIDENLSVITAVPGYVKPDRLEPILSFINDGVYEVESWENYVKNFKGKVKI